MTAKTILLSVTMVTGLGTAIFREYNESRNLKETSVKDRFMIGDIQVSGVVECNKRI